MIISVRRNGEGIGTINTQTRETDGGLPAVIQEAVTAETVVHLGGEDSQTEEWRRPTEEEVIRRVVAAADDVELAFPDNE